MSKPETYARNYLTRYHLDADADHILDLYNAFIAGYNKGESIKVKRKAPINVYRRIIEVVSEYYNMSSRALNQKTRKREIVQGRQICFYLGKNHTNLTLSALGKEFGKDHATVKHGIKVVNNLIDTDRQISHDIRVIEAQVRKIKLNGVNYGDKTKVKAEALG
jgi:hypothetical protein